MPPAAGRRLPGKKPLPLHREPDRAAGIPTDKLCKKEEIMEQLNKVELRGVVGSVRIQTYDENKMARISLATNFAYKDRDGTAVIDTSWHHIVAWEGRNIQHLEKIGKGTRLHVLGRVRYQNYTGVDGVDRVATDILACRVTVLDDEEPMQYEM